MGTKTEDRYYRYEYSRYQESWIDGVSQGASTVRPSGTAMYTRTRTGVNNPKWRSTIKSGGDATTPFSGSDFKVLRRDPFSLTVSQDYSNSGHAYSFAGNAFGNSNLSITRPNHVGGTSAVSADNLALSRALAKVRAEHTKFQGIVSLGELRETVNLLKHPFKGVDKYVNTYLRDLKKSKSFEALARKRTRKNEKSFLKTAADAWLETAFGIRPLISDVKDLTEAIIHHTYGSSRKTVVGYGESIASNASVGTLNAGYVTVIESWQDRTVLSVRYKVAIDTDLSAHTGGIERLQDALGFNLESFVPSIHNLIPWTFMVDYFTNLGDIIEAGCTNQTAVKFAVRTERLETTRTYLETPVPMAGFVGGNQRIGQGELVNRTVSRSSSPKLSIPSFELNLPGSAMKYGNILALMVSSENDIKRKIRF